jgi:hypothetical protein
MAENIIVINYDINQIKIIIKIIINNDRKFKNYQIHDNTQKSKKTRRQEDKN